MPTRPLPIEQARALRAQLRSEAFPYGQRAFDLGLLDTAKVSTRNDFARRFADMIATMAIVQKRSIIEVMSVWPELVAPVEYAEAAE